MNKTMKDLEDCFILAKEYKCKYVGVLIEMEGFETPELIINKRPNFDSKLAYYKKAYNEDLTLKTFNGIKIIDCLCGNNLNMMQTLFND